VSARRDDPVQFNPYSNGRGHYRRKVINLPPDLRGQLNAIERRTLQTISDLSDFLVEEQARQTQKPMRAGEPGE
jgi:hypothetical protein